MKQDDFNGCRECGCTRHGECAETIIRLETALNALIPWLDRTRMKEAIVQESLIIIKAALAGRDSK